MSTFKLTIHDGRVIEFEHSPHLFLPRYLRGKGIQNYEPISQAGFLAFVESHPGAAYDVGSNIGIYSLAAAAALRRRVIAFEPFDEASSVLGAISCANRFPIDVVKAAVSSEVGRTNFYISDRSDMSNSLDETFRKHVAIRDVEVTTIDAWSDREMPCFIKIDTESTESDVLRGAVQTIKRDRPALLLEVLTDDLARDVRAFLDAHDYAVLDLGSRDVRATLELPAGIDASGDERNWLALPQAIERYDYLIPRMRHWLQHLSRLPVAC